MSLGLCTFTHQGRLYCCYAKDRDTLRCSIVEPSTTPVVRTVEFKGLGVQHVLRIAPYVKVSVLGEGIT